jgi:transcriptional repressor NrdR
MKCPFCQHGEYPGSRHARIGEGCHPAPALLQQCDKRFTTYERIELIMPAVVKKNGSRTEFAADKLRGSLMLALQAPPSRPPPWDKPPSPPSGEKLLTSGLREVDSGYIGELVMQELKRLDKIAYPPASVYKNFEDLAEFQDAIAEVSRRKP